ncbi:chorismate mutase [Synechococcus sp. HJ21-Hayes]|jgi:chorismate mutase|uniref:chorismate mutase n=1 Tax=unclassified Synechococcus TaxID=2626047 RepID=UPI0020CE212D|nr:MULTISPECIES: chorismate mutase [unclassified Synechococcus]MCP9831784.1 chorismate mutase [Synechococcus sp. JJ3a-Johnson]MCP9853781.1 chorismate mutase [Synechococcus sp. HJ21-Hayes]
MSSPRSLRSLRGATTASANSAEAIAEAVAELLDALVERNGLEGSQVLSITFSVTTDLNACFPAAIARRRPGWDGVALLDCQQMAVEGDLPRCIRLLAHAWVQEHQPARHAYLREAARLRPDLADQNS